MLEYSATSVEVVADTDAGEGWVVFRWKHELYGYDELRIFLDGHCSRRMPIHSGDGLPEFVELRSDGIRLRFDPLLARKLMLEAEIDISFQLSEDELWQLRRAVDYFDGAGD